jgi:hypothetical protein
MNKTTTLLTDLEKTRVQAEEEFEKTLDSVISESISKYQPN